MTAVEFRRLASRADLLRHCAHGADLVERNAAHSRALRRWEAVLAELHRDMTAYANATSLEESLVVPR